MLTLGTATNSSPRQQVSSYIQCRKPSTPIGISKPTLPVLLRNWGAGSKPTGQKPQIHDRDPLGGNPLELWQSAGKLSLRSGNLFWNVRYMKSLAPMSCVPHCCWSAKNATSIKPMMTLEDIISAVAIFPLKRDASNMTYVGVVIRKSSMFWTKDINVTLSRKNNVGPSLFRIISLESVSESSRADENYCRYHL